jgi:peptidoglycan-associated lipoprotein
MIPATVLILIASGCAKEAVPLPASASGPGGSAGSTAGSRLEPVPSPSAGAGGTGLSASGRADSTTGAPGARPSPRDFFDIAGLKDIYFDFDKYEIRPEDAKILDATAAWLKSNAAHLLLIEGHCDERGTPEYNLALGERRAKAAMSYLTALGIQANRISIVSYGDQRPVCAEHGEACWAKNRRAHFLAKPE